MFHKCSSGDAPDDHVWWNNKGFLKKRGRVNDTVEFFLFCVTNNFVRSKVVNYD